MKRVGVREFRDHATQYLAGDEALTIERYGQPIGIYVPTGVSRHEEATQAIERLQAVERVLERTGLTKDKLAGKKQGAAEAMERLAETVKLVLAESGLTEDELADFFDLSKPMPDLPERARDAGTTDSRASSG